jgi:hypothetical protein
MMPWCHSLRTLINWQTGSLSGTGVNQLNLQYINLVDFIRGIKTVAVVLAQNTKDI